MKAFAAVESMKKRPFPSEESRQHGLGESVLQRRRSKDVNGRLQPNASLRLRACAFSARALTREWAAGVGVTTP
jgi:hypothetical protein